MSRIAKGSLVLSLGLLALSAAWGLAGVSANRLLEAEIYGIHWYQGAASPLVAGVLTCRFQPTCSQFGLEALQTRGLVAGNLFIAGRLLHCSPLGFVWDAVTEPGVS